MMVIYFHCAGLVADVLVEKPPKNTTKTACSDHKEWRRKYVLELNLGKLALLSPCCCMWEMTLWPGFGKMTTTLPHDLFCSTGTQVVSVVEIVNGRGWERELGWWVGGGGSSDGERGQHSSEASGVLVDGDELWPLVHFKSVSVKSTPENSFFLLQRSWKQFFFNKLVTMTNDSLIVLTFEVGGTQPMRNKQDLTQNRLSFKGYGGAFGCQSNLIKMHPHSHDEADEQSLWLLNWWKISKMLSEKSFYEYLKKKKKIAQVWGKNPHLQSDDKIDTTLISPQWIWS